MNRSFVIVSSLAVVSALTGCESSNQSEPAYAQPGYAQPGYGQQGPYGQPSAQPGYGQPQGQPASYPQPGTTAPAPEAQPQPQQPSIGGFPFPFPFPGMPGMGGSTGSTGGSTGGGTGGTTQPAPSQTGGQAAQIDPMFAGIAVIPLTQMQVQHAPGATKNGPMLVGNFQEGQILEQTFTLMPNKCYTVVASGAGIQELDVRIVVLAPIPGQPPTLAQDNMTGSTAVLGSNNNCFRWQFPLGANAKWIMTATKGSGMAAGQLYVK